MNDVFRILSIDGGGVRGIIPATVLANLETLLDALSGEPTPMGQRFDLIAGTSVGGIVGLALALGHRASYVRDKLDELIPKVFAESNRNANRLSQWWKNQYSPLCLEEQVKGIFADKTLADLKTDCCVTSVALETATPRFHKTDYFHRNAGRLSETLVNVAMATSAAPTYFPARSTVHSTNLIDGGIAANNPSVVALVDALQFERPSKRGTAQPALGASEGRPVIAMLSVGTGRPATVPYDPKSLSDGGEYNWARPIYEVMSLTQSMATHFQASFLLHGRYFRIDPLMPNPIKLDDGVRYKELRGLFDVTQPLQDFAKSFLI